MTAAQRPAILFVVPSLHGGGAEFVARTWMKWLAERGCRVSVVTTGVDADPLLLPQGVEAFSVAAARGHLAKSRAVRDVFEQTGADVALALQAHANLVLITAGFLARGRRPRIVVSERNLVSLGLTGSTLSHRAKIWLARRLYRRADHVVAISHPVGGELVSWFGVRGDRMTVVANPATAKVQGRARVARVPGIAQGVQLVLPCRLVEQKRPLLAIQTAAELAGRGVAAEVVSFGGGPLLHEVKAEARRLGVPFVNHGWVEDWFAHVDSNAIVVLPSIREGFGNVLIEAAAMGLPSVAVSGALGVADAIVPGMTGDLALTDHPGDLADAVIRVSALDLHGIDGWLARFSPDRSGQDLLSVLEAVIARRQRGLG